MRGLYFEDMQTKAEALARWSGLIAERHRRCPVVDGQEVTDEDLRIGVLVRNAIPNDKDVSVGLPLGQAEGARPDFLKVAGVGKEFDAGPSLRGRTELLENAIDKLVQEAPAICPRRAVQSTTRMAARKRSMKRSFALPIVGHSVWRSQMTASESEVSSSSLRAARRRN